MDEELEGPPNRVTPRASFCIITTNVSTLPYLEGLMADRLMDNLIDWMRMVSFDP